VVNSRIKVKPGEPLNVVEAEKSRQSLARSRVDSVRLRYERWMRTRAMSSMSLKMQSRFLSVLAGYGSYELVARRTGVREPERVRLAHDLQVARIQSFKSTSGDLLYTIPEAFGDNVSVLDRARIAPEEVTFTREEYGGSVGFKKCWFPIKTDFSIRYDTNGSGAESGYERRTGRTSDATPPPWCELTTTRATIP